MERNEELVDVSMEVFDNVVLNRRILPVNMLSTDNLVRNAVRRYDDAPYIPDNTFVVLRCPLDGKIPGSDYFDTATCPPVHIRYSNNAKNLKRQRARSSPINIRRSLQRYTSGAGFPPERPATKPTPWSAHRAMSSISASTKVPCRASTPISSGISIPLRHIFRRRETIRSTATGWTTVRSCLPRD